MDIKDLERALQLNRNKELRRKWRCPGELGLAEYLDGKTSARKKNRIEKHLSRCEFCLHQVALLLGLAESERPQVPRELLRRAERIVNKEPVSVIPRLRSNWAVPAAAIACGLLLVSVIWLGLPSRWEIPQSGEPTDYQTLRGGESNTAELKIINPPEGTNLNRDAAYFKWNVLENSLFYEVHVVDLEGNPMWSARVNASETLVPPSVELPAGQYFVVVRAVMADGKLTSSKFVQFSIR